VVKHNGLTCKCQRIHPSDAFVYNDLGDAYRVRVELEQAALNYKKAIEIAIQLRLCSESYPRIFYAAYFLLRRLF
jgi:hypothetical protein